jgi:hypothetical protein
MDNPVGDIQKRLEEAERWSSKYGPTWGDVRVLVDRIKVLENTLSPPDSHGYESSWYWDS